jgi:hypothetical protein
MPRITKRERRANELLTQHDLMIARGGDLQGYKDQYGYDGPSHPSEIYFDDLFEFMRLALNLQRGAEAERLINDALVRSHAHDEILTLLRPVRMK